MNTENQIDPNIPLPGETEVPDLKTTVGWILQLALKFGAGYLAKVIMDALGF